MFRKCLTRAVLSLCSEVELSGISLVARPISFEGCSGHGNCLRRPSSREHTRKYSQDTNGRYLTGKSAVVTGSTSGIGLGIAEGLAERGANVILSGIGDQDLIQRLQNEISSKYGVKAQYLNADLSNPEDIEQLCHQVLYLYPSGVDILINNAGLQHVCDVENFPVEKWDLLISVMLSAPFHFTRLLLPLMRQKGWGRIINLASIHGLVASSNKAAYCSAKHGVLGLTKVVALETAGSGVTCNAVCPGFVNTPIFQAQVNTRAEQQKISLDEAKNQILEQVHPTKEAVEISQIADLVNFLCSKSTDQMTGSVLTMDAGWTAR